MGEGNFTDFSPDTVHFQCWKCHIPFRLELSTSSLAEKMSEPCWPSAWPRCSGCRGGTSNLSLDAWEQGWHSTVLFT